MSWKQNNGRDRGHIDGIGYFLKGPNEQSGGSGAGPTGPTGPASTVTGPTGYTGPTGPPINTSLFVPYTGAIGAVNLGNFDLTVQNMTIGKGAGGNVSFNTAIGYQALSVTSTLVGSFNTAIGYQAIVDTSGSFNTAIGYQALSSNTGNNNTAIGYQALSSNTFDGPNTAIGSDALFKNKEAGNTANGYQALYNNILGGSNTAIGHQALFNNNNSSSNTAIGLQALYNNVDGSYNTAIGYNAGPTVTNPNLFNCTFIGFDATDPSGNNNTIILGNSLIQHLKCQVGLTITSDERDKKEIEPLTYGLDYINEIKPVHFLWNMRDGGKIDIPEIGFTAQNLKAAQRKLNINIPNLVDDYNPEHLGVCSALLIPILVKSIQELSTQLNETNKKLEELTAKVNSIL